MMTDSSNENYWAQLVSVTDVDSPPKLITNDKFVIGRVEDCDISFAGNKLVSGKHCYIERDGDRVWLYDTSTNGTLLNMKTKLSKGECRQLEHGDEIHIVYKKNATEQNIGYMYQERDKLEEEVLEESTQDYAYNLDMTLSDEAVNQVSDPDISDSMTKSGTKRKADDKDEDKTENFDKSKKTKTEMTEPNQKPQTSRVVDDEVKPSTSKEGAGDGNNDNDNDDGMLETLTCIICQEILHDCISLQPCMHSFCAGCYSEWMDHSNKCPSCRAVVDRINKNHLVNNLVEAYLKNKPGKRRPEEELKELDGKNKITRDMLYPARKNTDNEYDEGEEHNSSPSDDNYDDDDDNGDSDCDNNNGGGGGGGVLGGLFGGLANAVGGIVGGFGTPFFGNQTVRPNAAVCRQCPGHDATLGVIPPVPQQDQDDEDAKTFPMAPDYSCSPRQNHVLCLCCLQPMPDRRAQYMDGGDLPPQQCTICLRSFCHAYWGCRIPRCNGCMGKLKDMNFGKGCLTSLLLNNGYESSVIKDYLASKDMSVKELWAECLAKMVTGEYSCINQYRLTNGINTPVCYACGLNMFRDLAYAFRKEIPNDDLPREVTRRPDCYWGKNCNTQRNKPEHARRFNHVCEQTRTA